MAKKSGNPFDPADIQKMFADLSLPGVDWKEVMASQQKNLAALTEANQRMMAGAQEVMQQQTSIITKAMAELASASTELMSQGDPQADAQKRFDLAKTSFESAFKNMQEMAEVAGQSNSEAMQIINKRAAEAFEEIKAHIQAKTSS